MAISYRGEGGVGGARGAGAGAGSSNAKKLNQLDRRSKAVAPKKKYSDMTPAEKRKWDSINAEATNRLTKKTGKK